MVLVETGFFPRDIEFDSRMLATVIDVINESRKKR